MHTDAASPERTLQLAKTSEAAALLRVDQTTIRRMAAKGELTPIRIGGSVRFAIDDIRALIDAGRKGGAA